MWTRFNAAVEVQEALESSQQALSEDRRSSFRIGVHVGDVMVKGGDLFGDGVNIAARLQALSEPGGVCLSEEAHHHARKAVLFGFTDLGPQPAKNIEGGVRAFAIQLKRQSGSGATINKAPVPSDRPSVAVLPFENLSGQPDDTYFSDGISDEIITGLARFRTLVRCRPQLFVRLPRQVH